MTSTPSFFTPLEGQQETKLSPSVPEQKSASSFFTPLEEPQEDSWLKSGIRSALQIPLGAAQKFTYPLNLLQLFGQGEALAGLEELSDERIEELKALFPSAPWENFKGIDREKYLEGVQAASNAFPTQQNLERLIEDKTGIPLTPKNKLQNLARLGGTAGAFKQGNIGQKAIAGAIAPATAAGLESVGVPEPLAELAGLGVSSANIPTPSISRVTKPSGLTTRRFEGITKPTKVSEGRFNKINEKVESDFKKISDDLFEGSNPTYSAMKKDPTFKRNVEGLFEKVTENAESIEGTINPLPLRNGLRDRVTKNNKGGLTPDEYEKAYRKEMKVVLKDLPRDEMSAAELVQQYRKNNKSLSGYFEAGKSNNANRAKRDVLLDYNREIAEVIQKKYPDTEFSKLFEQTNKQWSQIKDVESIDKFMEDLFTGKVNYNKGRAFFDKEKVSKPFERLLGEENFNKFETLMDDLMSTEKAMSLVKSAQSQGYKDIGKMAVGYLIHPSLAKGKFIVDVSKTAWKSLLDKPKLMVTWKKGIDNMKNGNFSEAEKAFIALDKELDVESK